MSKSKENDMNIHDIAKKANVSIATVSRVINGSDVVTEKTRLKVEDAIREGKYTPNVFARGLRIDSMKMIGIICTDVSDIYYANAVSVLEQELRIRGFDSMLCCTGNDLEEKKKSVAFLLEKRVDAIIMVGSAFLEKQDNSHLEIAAAQVPVITINGSINLPNVYCIKCDEDVIATECVKLLVESGHKKILFMYDFDTDSSIRKRKGYIKGLYENLNEEERKKGEIIVQTEMGIDGSQNSFLDYVKNHGLPGAVLTSNDALAVGVLKACETLDVSIPIIGYNNSILSKCTTPSLTTVDNKVEILCKDAIKTLLNVFEDKIPPQTQIVKCNLVRRSTF